MKKIIIKSCCDCPLCNVTHDEADCNHPDTINDFYYYDNKHQEKSVNKNCPLLKESYLIEVKK